MAQATEPPRDIEAAQAAVLLEERLLRAHPDNPGSWNDEYRSGPADELVELLNDRFDTDGDTMLAYRMMVEAYRLGRDER